MVELAYSCRSLEVMTTMAVGSQESRDGSWAVAETHGGCL